MTIGSDKIQPLPYSILDDRRCCLSDETRDIMPEVYETCWSEYFAQLEDPCDTTCIYTPLTLNSCLRNTWAVETNALSYVCLAWKKRYAEDAVGCLLGDEQRFSWACMHDFLLPRTLSKTNQRGEKKSTMYFVGWWCSFFYITLSSRGEDQFCLSSSTGFLKHRLSQNSSLDFKTKKNPENLHGHHVDIPHWCYAVSLTWPHETHPIWGFRFPFFVGFSNSFKFSWFH